MYKKIFIALILLTSVCFAQSSGEGTSGINTNLLAAQKISVTIGGDFFINGTFAALRTERVDEFLTRLYNETRAAAMQSARDEMTLIQISEKFEKYALRNITLKRKDGSERILDLKKFRLTGNFEHNPYLENGDVIILPALDLDNNFVEVSGAVNKPITFQYVDSDKLDDALLFAMGVNKAYKNADSAEVYRLSYDGFREEFITVGLGEDFYLERGDRIKVIGNEPHKLDYQILVTGEVVNPGYIFVPKDGITLEEAIKRAGGLTENAWLEKGQLVRGEAARLFTRERPLFPQESEELDRLLEREQFMLSRLSNLIIEDTAYFNMESQMLFYNNVGIRDFSELQDSSSDLNSFVVKDEDVIYIPEFENVVSVFGQVPKAGKYEFEPGKGYWHYINKAGGLGERATDEIMVIKGVSKNWISTEDDRKIELEPGDYIWVPKERYRDFGFYLQRVGSIAGIFGTIATLILLINELGK